MYLTIFYVTNPMLAANARGENDGNIQSLQKTYLDNAVYTLVSGYSIKRAIRDIMQVLGATIWRTTLSNADPTTHPAGYGYGPDLIPGMAGAIPDPAAYDDVTLFGFMIAEKVKKPKKVAGEEVDDDSDDSDDSGEAESGESEGPEVPPKGKKGKKGKAAPAPAPAPGEKVLKVNPVLKHTGAVEVSVAIATTPYHNEMAFVRGLKPTGEPNPFSAERDMTRYTGLMNINLDDLGNRPRAFGYIIQALKAGLRVGGSHASNATQMTCDYIAWRLHKEPGCGGMYLGPIDVPVNPLPIDFDPMKTRAENHGFTYQSSSYGTITQTLTEILDACESYLGGLVR